LGEIFLVLGSQLIEFHHYVRWLVEYFVGVWSRGFLGWGIAPVKLTEYGHFVSLRIFWLAYNEDKQREHYSALRMG